MNHTKLLVIMAAVLIAIGWGGTALAFHEGGVGVCDGCHTMHNSPDNPVGNEDTNLNASPNGLLMKGSDASSTCLNCHAGAGSATSYHILSDDASVQSPGGDFFWLTQTYEKYLGWGPPTNTKEYEGQNTGHNVIAADFTDLPGVDTNNSTAPGGSYSAINLACTSCHDPHGQVVGGTANDQPPVEHSGSYGEGPADPANIVGNYRLLGDTFYDPPGPNPGWTADAPIAAADGAEQFSETDASHVDYGSGMSEWCGNCHGDYLGDSTMHPAGDTVHLDTLAANYNAYVETGNNDGLIGTAYLHLVPFERGETDRTLLAPTSTAGPSGTSNVMCLTCHRAHASAFQNATRWDTEAEFLAESTPTMTEVPAMANDQVPYYGKTFGEFQRSLCNKCHIQD